MAVAGCGGDDDPAAGNGSVSVLLEAEGTITDGIEAGDGEEDIRDGWGVAYDRYVVVIGEISIHLSTDSSVEASDPAVFAVDLTTVPADGLPLWSIADLREGEWDFNYGIHSAAEGAERDDSVSQADFDAMAAADATYRVAGTMAKADGQSCPPKGLAMSGSAVATGTNAGGDDCYANASIHFDLLVPAETSFGPCEIDEMPGFSVAADSATTVAATIHGDHLFFNGFPEGSEGGVTRLAQWLADCDLDLDGEVTRAELEAIAPSDLAELDDRYQLGGSPITPLATMWSYVVGQLKTQGHFQGEGECPFDGMVHDHD
ncbi:MAG: hypothetical protein R3B72_38990 [Polyangiaceae bacterium]